MPEHNTNIVEDNVEAELYEVDQLREQYPGWDDLEADEKLDVLADTEPADTVTAHNIITEPFRNYLSELINPDVTTQGAIDTTHMAFGDDNTTPSLSDAHLINEIYRDQINDHVDRTGAEYAGTILIQSDEAVGDNLVEAALVTESDSANADDIALNRVVLTDSRLDPKDDDHAVTVTISLSFLDESEAV